MNVRWSALAAADMERIFAYVAKENPEAARGLVKALYDGASELRTFPLRGRVGRMPGRRELVVQSLPYVIVYRVKGETVEISRVLHGARRYP